jgi:biopolymer transport protein ExbD
MRYLPLVCLVAATLVTRAAPVVAQSPVMQQGISVQLAVTSNAVPMPGADTEDALIVTVIKNGGMYFGIDPITSDVLAERLKSTQSNKPKKTLYIKADTRTLYLNVVKVLEAARSAGADSPILLTSQPESSKTRSWVVPKGLQVELDPPAGMESIVVQVLTSRQPSTTVKIDKEEVPWAALQNTLSRIVPHNGREKVVLLKADDNMPFGQVAKAIDVSTASGAWVVLVKPGP